MIGQHTAFGSYIYSLNLDRYLSIFSNQKCFQSISQRQYFSFSNNIYCNDGPLQMEISSNQNYWFDSFTFKFNICQSYGWSALKVKAVHKSLWKQTSLDNHANCLFWIDIISMSASGKGGLGSTKFVAFESLAWHNECFICNICKGSMVGKGFIQVNV